MGFLLRFKTFDLLMDIPSLREYRLYFKDTDIRKVLNTHIYIYIYIYILPAISCFCFKVFYLKVFVHFKTKWKTRSEKPGIHLQDKFWMQIIIEHGFFHEKYISFCRLRCFAIAAIIINSHTLVSTRNHGFTIWVRSRRCGCLVTWFCHQLIAKPRNKTATPSWPDPYLCETIHAWLNYFTCLKLDVREVCIIRLFRCCFYVWNLNRPSISGPQYL